jgi:hypothetical protein
MRKVAKMSEQPSSQNGKKLPEKPCAHEELLVRGQFLGAITF